MVVWLGVGHNSGGGFHRDYADYVPKYAPTREGIPSKLEFTLMPVHGIMLPCLLHIEI